MNINLFLMHKTGLAIQNVARTLAGLSIGQKMPTVTEMSESYDIARGTIQQALAKLKELGAVELTSRGHMGTYIDKIDYIKLAQICEATRPVGTMPLPYSKRYEGLATGIYSQLNHGGLAGNIAFIRGSRKRVQNLLEGRSDFAIMSKMALTYFNSDSEDLHEIVNLGNLTYVERHVVMVRKGFDGNWDGIKVGVDETSIDQLLLTQAYFENKDVTVVPMMYSQILSSLQEGTIDAGVWNMDDVDLLARGIATFELDNDRYVLEDTQAVIVCRKGDMLTARLIQDILDPEKVVRYQQEVMAGKRTPKY